MHNSLEERCAISDISLTTLSAAYVNHSMDEGPASGECLLGHTCHCYLHVDCVPYKVSYIIASFFGVIRLERKRPVCRYIQENLSFPVISLFVLPNFTVVWLVLVKRHIYLLKDRIVLY